MELDTLAALNAERAARRAAVLVTDVESGEQRLVRAAEVASDPLAEPIRKALRTGKSGLIKADGVQAFLTVAVPSVRLVVIGAVHISQALVPMAAQLDLCVTIIDPRTAFATPDRFPGTELIAEWPEEALKKIAPLDGYTALAALSHDPRIDDPALSAALRAGCFYVGALGSRKTQGARDERLRAAGFSEAEIERIHGPIGLAIGAATPAEIALSILAEIVAIRRTTEHG